MATGRVETLTRSNNEITFGDILDGKTQVEVPYYQRTYKWSKKQIEGLIGDLESLLDDDDDGAHFMGAVIVFQETESSRHARRYYVIDGQQRLTTLSLLLLAVTCSMAKHDATEEARDTLTDRLILLQRQVQGRSNFALTPGAQDRQALNQVVKQVIDTRSLADLISEDHHFVPHETHGAAPSSRVAPNFKLMLQWADEQWELDGLARLEALVDLVLQRLTFVEIFVKDPLSGPLIFDRLNARGEALTIGELVKNDIFSRGGVPFDELALLDRTVWDPFARRFGNPKLLEKYFFPFALCDDPNVKKGDVYRSLQERWLNEGISSDPKAIVARLELMVDDFLSATSTSHAQSCHPPEIAIEFEQLLMAGAPGAVLPFLMQISHGVRQGEISAPQGVDALRTVQAFLVRRAICGMEPTGLHAVFKGLWNNLDLSKKKLGLQIREIIDDNATVEWPDDETVRARVANRRMYYAKVTKFVLLEFDRSHGGEVPEFEPTIDHIFPQHPKSGEWQEWSAVQDVDRVHTLANLALLSQSQNSKISNQEWEKRDEDGELDQNCKRAIYRDKSATMTTRKIGESFKTWTPRDLEVRNSELTAWILNRWA